jgi:hypothetical protein
MQKKKKASVLKRVIPQKGFNRLVKFLRDPFKFSMTIGSRTSSLCLCQFKLSQAPSAKV